VLLTSTFSKKRQRKSKHLTAEELEEIESIERDVTFIVESKEIKAHSSLLKHYSEYFAVSASLSASLIHIERLSVGQIEAVVG